MLSTSLRRNEQDFDQQQLTVSAEYCGSERPACPEQLSLQLIPNARDLLCYEGHHNAILIIHGVLCGLLKAQ